jgi:hypothetical protein
MYHAGLGIMQEVFEGLVKEGLDMIDDAVSHTDVVALLKYLKVQRAIAENHRLVIEHEIDKPGVIDPLELDLLLREACDFARYIEIYDYVIDLIESGRFAKE